MIANDPIICFAFLKVLKAFCYKTSYKSCDGCEKCTAMFCAFILATTHAVRKVNVSRQNAKSQNASFNNKNVSKSLYSFVKASLYSAKTFICYIKKIFAQTFLPMSCILYSSKSFCTKKIVGEKSTVLKKTHN